MKKIFMFSIALVLGLFLQGHAMAQTTEGDIIPSATLMPGVVEDTGTHFEVTDSEYLNIVLDSSETITLRLESIPEMVTMHVEPTSEAASTQITISGVQPSTTYYKYEDNYHNLNEFTTDGNGSYSWTQDLSQSHLVFIQPRKSTKFIADNATGGDCYLIGTWDSATKTCTLTTDVYETIQIDSNYITLDGNGHAIKGAWTAYGIHLYRRVGVIIKNLTVERFGRGILLYYSNSNTLTDNTISSNAVGVEIACSSNNTLTGNATLNNSYGFILANSSNNILINNVANNKYFDLHIVAEAEHYCNNIIANLIGSGGKPIKYFNSSVNLENEIVSQLVLCNADHSSIKNVIIDRSNKNGLFILWTDYSNIENTVSFDTLGGIALYFSNNNTLIGNFTSSTPFGIRLSYSNGNTVRANNISDNADGIIVYFSSNNKIYNNNFNNNGIQASVRGGSGNIFNLDTPIGGNYWSDFDTPAEGCYDTNNDGFCDTPYYFYGGVGVDYLPWAKQRVPADTTPPATTAAISGTSGNNGWYISDVIISLSATDSGSGVKEIRYRTDGSAETVVSGNLASLTINTDGMHTLTYYAIDSANNSEISHSLSINIDKTPPVIIVTGISNGATYQSGIVPSPSYTVTDNLSGVASSNASDTNDNGTCMITHTYTVTASDIAGNGATKVATYYVTSTSTGVMALIDQMLASGLISNDGIANSLIQQAGNNNWNAFINHVNAQTGKFIDPSVSELLIQAAKIAMQC